LVNQREIGSHTKSFAAGATGGAREDPDVILVGEMRDLETISLALTAAETGHLVFGTLHTKSAPKTIDRIIDAFPPAQQQQVRVQLAEALQGVVSQLLLPTKDKKGRVAAFEIMVATVAIRNLIGEGRPTRCPRRSRPGRSSACRASSRLSATSSCRVGSIGPTPRACCSRPRRARRWARPRRRGGRAAGSCAVGAMTIFDWC
jgi:twitching motility protein PilT